MARAKISDVRGKKAVVLPDDIAARLNLFAGETVYIHETSRGLEIVASTSLERSDMRDAEKTLAKYRRNWRYAGG